MKITYFPNETSVKEDMQKDEPLLILIKHDKSEIIAAQIDEAVEHHILLSKVGLNPLVLDEYFRIVLTNSEASWTFVCPSGYKGIPNKEKRIEEFYKDGVNVITWAAKELGYAESQIDIPSRYRRHINYISGNKEL